MFFIFWINFKFINSIDCVDRVEKNLNRVDERDRNIAERLAKVEESVVNVTKRVDEMSKMDST